MRIGQFSESFLPIVDGVGRVVYSYANGLAKGSDECYVIAPQNNTGYRGGYRVGRLFRIPRYRFAAI